MLPLFLLSLVLPIVEAAPRYSTWLADSAISRGQGHSPLKTTPHLTYEYGVFHRALEALYDWTGNETYWKYVESGLDAIVDSSGKFRDGYYNMGIYSLDSIRLGPSFLRLYKTTGMTKYKATADLLRSQLNTQPRTAEGAFWHLNMFPNEQWLDGLYMADVFYAQHSFTFQPSNNSAWSDILLQFRLVERHTLQPATGLFYHGYDYSKKAVWANPVTGASPEVWIRALGWYAMALVDTLDYFPDSNPGFPILTGIVSRLASSLKSSADISTGSWYLVMSQPGSRKGNYIESSGSSMFVYFLLKAIRLGYIDKETYLPTATRAYYYLSAKFVIKEPNGTAGWGGTVLVGSLGGLANYDYYISIPINKNDLKGVSPFILASIEYEMAVAGSTPPPTPPPPPPPSPPPSSRPSTALTHATTLISGPRPTVSPVGGVVSGATRSEIVSPFPVVLLVSLFITSL